MSRCSLESKKANQHISEDSRHRLNYRSTTLELIPSLNYFTFKRQQKEEQTDSLKRNQSIDYSLSAVSDSIKTLETLEKKSKKAMSSANMSVQEFMKAARENDDTDSASNVSDSAPSDFSGDGEAEYVDSFTHYLFLKTDFSLSRISRKLIQQLNDINLAFDDPDVSEEIHNHRINKRESDNNMKRSRSDRSTERKRSISDGQEQRAVSCLSSRPSQKMLSSVGRQDTRTKHDYGSWLDQHKKKNLKCSKTTKIIRIDINEIDQVASSEIHGVHYLEELFKESSINKFYSFDNKNLSSQSFFLATNESISTNSLNSEMSEDTFQKTKKKKQKQEKKRRARARAAQQSHHQQQQANHHSHHSHHSHGSNRSHSEAPKKKKRGFVRTATMNLIGKVRGRRDRSEDSVVSLETEYSADTRSYHTKRFEIADTELDHFLGSGRMNKRRNAIVHKIDTMYCDSELHTFMENLLRAEYIETFLL